jgi:CBS domain-containing protein
MDVPFRPAGRPPDSGAAHDGAGREDHATAAGQMMSAPALTVAPEATLAQAGRRTRHQAVNRLLVTGADRRLLGIVTAADLFKAYDRPDEAIGADLRQVMAELPAAAPRSQPGSGPATLMAFPSGHPSGRA